MTRTVVALPPETIQEWYKIRTPLHVQLQVSCWFVFFLWGGVVRFIPRLHLYLGRTTATAPPTRSCANSDVHRSMSITLQLAPDTRQTSRGATATAAVGNYSPWPYLPCHTNLLFHIQMVFRATASLQPRPLLPSPYPLSVFPCLALPPPALPFLWPPACVPVCHCCHSKPCYRRNHLVPLTQHST